MNKRVATLAGLVVLLVIMVIGCAGGPEEETEPVNANVPEPILRRPDLLDHKNYKFGREVPEWVVMDATEIEDLSEYEDVYVFKYESPRAQSLQGAELWTRNFTAASQIAQTVQNRVQVKFAGAAVGDMNMVESYMEQVVQSLSDAEFSGYQPEADYWIQMRYYQPDGSVDEDAYTYLVMYTIPRTTLDGMIQDALENADDEPDTEEEVTARQRVREAFENGLD